MNTSEATQKLDNKRVIYKTTDVIPSAWHVKDPQWVGYVNFDGEIFWTDYFDSKEEAETELRCLQKQTSYEVVKTMEDEGYYPERAKVLESQYQKMGITSGLYSDLNG